MQYTPFNMYGKQFFLIYYHVDPYVLVVLVYMVRLCLISPLYRFPSHVSIFLYERLKVFGLIERNSPARTLNVQA